MSRWDRRARREAKKALRTAIPASVLLHALLFLLLTLLTPQRVGLHADREAVALRVALPGVAASAASFAQGGASGPAEAIARPLARLDAHHQLPKADAAIAATRAPDRIAGAPPAIQSGSANAAARVAAATVVHRTRADQSTFSSGASATGDRLRPSGNGKKSHEKEGVFGVAPKPVVKASAGSSSEGGAHAAAISPVRPATKSAAGGRGGNSGGAQGLAGGAAAAASRVASAGGRAAREARREGKRAAGPAVEGKASAASVLAVLEERIQHSRVYPPAARRRGIEGAVTVSMSVGAGGWLAGERVVSSSGSRILDEAGLRLVRGIFPVRNPFGHSFTAEVRIVYRLDS